MTSCLIRLDAPKETKPRSGHILWPWDCNQVLLVQDHWCKLKQETKTLAQEEDERWTWEVKKQTPF